MITFDSSEIVNWADKPDSSHQLPELVRKLILATIPQPSSISMPSGSSVRMPGWDGLLEVFKGNSWVPHGKSAWEFTCNKKSKQKADEDYKKRTQNTLGIVQAQTTVSFVTARRWPGKGDWVIARKGESRWSDVCFLDADDLVVWLEQAPAVAGWFSNLIGKLPEKGVVPLGEWWEHWKSATQPQITPDLVLAGRRDRVDDLQLWAEGDAESWYVRAYNRDEAIAYLAAAASDAVSTWGPTFLSRALVVQTEDAWRSLEHHPYPMVLVRGFIGPASSQIAIRNGHHVLVPLDTSQEPQGSGQTLNRLPRDETIESLVAMGINEASAKSLAQKSARRLPILYRSLIDQAGYPGPDWAATPSDSLTALVLLGQWEEDHEGDKSIVERLVGKSFEEVEHDITALGVIPDPPMVKVGPKWRFVSHEEAWHLLAPRLTTSLVDRFKNLAIEIMEQASPAFELPIEERYLATARGKVLPHSSTLRQGIARTLALMGLYHDRVRFSDSAEYVPSQVVASSLPEERGWPIWATLYGELTTLAEAAPDALLDAVERHLSACPSPLSDLFLQEGTPPFGGIPHTGLLWALELLAWSVDHFSRVVMILARLAELDSGGKATNRPADSLRSLFLPWIRFSETPDHMRLETLQSLLCRYPEVGWKLLLAVYPSAYDTVMERQLPNWRPWGQDASLSPTIGECRAFIETVEKHLIDLANSDIQRWSDLVDIIQDLSPQTRREALESLLRKSESLGGQLASLDLWGRIRFQLHRHRLHPDADWAIAAKEVSLLAQVYDSLPPSDPVWANSWLFDGWVDLPDPVATSEELSDPNSMDKSEQLKAAQQDAVGVVYESGGTASIIHLAEAARNPGDVGVAIAQTMNAEWALSLASAHIGSITDKLREFAHEIASVLFHTSNWEPLERILKQVKTEGADPGRVAAVYLCASADLETWGRLDLETPEVRDAYWRQVPAFRLPRQDPEGMAIGVQQLLGARRSPDLLGILCLDDVEVERIVPVLEQLPLDIAREVQTGRRPKVESYVIAKLLQKLDESNDIAIEVIARLEIPFISGLDRDRPNLVFLQEVLKEPSLFADLISWAYKRSDEQTEENIDEEEMRSRSKGAHRVLSRMRGLPGQVQNGAIDPEGLENWVNEVRRFCKERARVVIGDQQIGKVLANAPIGADGAWPCEPVRDVLDSLRSSYIGDGLVVGKSNLRGTTSRAPLDGGQQERALANQYRSFADLVSAKWPFTAQLLRKIADSYRRKAQWFDQHSEWLDETQL